MNLFGDDLGASTITGDTSVQNHVSNVGFHNANGVQATLWVFPPKVINDQTRRSHLYQFGGEFRMELQDHLQRMTTGSHVNHLQTLMPQSVLAKSAILPSAVGQEVKLSVMSSHWTFVLIIDNGNSLTPMGMASCIPSRTFYSGYIMDEPVKVASFTAGQLVHNPAAVFTCTHHTTLVVNSTPTSTGTYDQINVSGDYDYICPAMQNLESSGTTLLELTPQAVTNNIVCSDMGVGTFHVMGGNPIASTASVEVASELNSPTHHLGKLVGGMNDSIRLMSQSNNANDIFSGNDTLLSSMASLYGGDRNFVANDLDPKLPFTMQEIVSKYPNIVINQGDWPAAQTHEVTSSQAATKRNVMANIVQSALPPIVASLGLASVAFRYNSAQRQVGGLGSMGGAKGVWHLMEISTLYGQANASSTSWANLQSYLTTTVFPIILANAGEFDLIVYCAVSGSTIVNLQLLDEVVAHGLLETSNLFGGMNTPLVGHNQELQHNASQIYGAVMDIRSDLGNVGVQTVGGVPLF